MNNWKKNMKLNKLFLLFRCLLYTHTHIRSSLSHSNEFKHLAFVFAFNTKSINENENTGDQFINGNKNCLFFWLFVVRALNEQQCGPALVSCSLKAHTLNIYSFATRNMEQNMRDRTCENWLHPDNHNWVLDQRRPDIWPSNRAPIQSVGRFASRPGSRTWWRRRSTSWVLPCSCRWSVGSPLLSRFPHHL